MEGLLEVIASLVEGIGSFLELGRWLGPKEAEKVVMAADSLPCAQSNVRAKESRNRSSVSSLQ
jgi:hypothetical protein